MATKPGAVANWDQQLAEQAAIATKQMETVMTGQFFSIKGGILALGGNPVVGNTAVTVIAAHTFEHAFYEGEYDDQNPATPVCFAFGTDETTMAPHQKSLKPQAEKCSKCPQNQFGTAVRGKGKACKNVMRLCLLPAGQADAVGKVTVSLTEESLAAASPIYLRLPVTSVKVFAAYVTTLTDNSRGFRVPPFAVITKIKPMPDPKTQVKVTFEFLERVPNAAVQVAINRHTELQENIGFPYMAIEAPDAKTAATKPGKRGKY
jgi:hypothetical protein